MNKKTDGTSAIKKCLSILSCFSFTKTEMTLTEITQELQYPFPTVSRLVKALEEEGFLERDKKSKQYRLGYKCTILSSIAQKTVNIRSLSLPYMESLKNRFNETVNLYIRDGDYRICLEQVESTHNLRRSAKLGDKFPLWAGASGRCFLAFMSQEELEFLIQNAQKITRFTVIDKQVILEKNNVLRKNGFTISVSERENGVSSVASPILDNTGRPVACIAVSGPTSRLSDDMIQALIPELKKSCYLISKKLGAQNSELVFLDNDGALHTNL
ncbi:IclR family transcriptional regulator [Aminivibrio sp.]|jgi:IclR family KDG regulon transcriptional repressor|uniref:IclR family transcriptional regulator n=1 Tax=Aminivibrio sp. TaxID=1872489 RepID=UPI003D98338F